MKTKATFANRADKPRVGKAGEKTRNFDYYALHYTNEIRQVNRGYMHACYIGMRFTSLEKAISTIEAKKAPFTSGKEIKIINIHS